MPKGVSAQIRQAPLPKSVHRLYSKKFNEAVHRISLVKLSSLNIFTTQQLGKLKDVKKYPVETIDALYTFSSRLVAYPFDLSTEQILKVASFKDADVTLRDLRDNFVILREHGFTINKIIRIASVENGWNNIKKAVEKFTPKPVVEKAPDNTALGDTQAQTLVVAEAPKRSKIVDEASKKHDPLMGVQLENEDFIDGLGFMAYDSPSDLSLAPFPMSDYGFNIE